MTSSKHKSINIRPALRACVAVLLSTAMLVAQDFPDVTAISLEDLMNLRVTSVSKREQKLADAPAAIFVITQEDIHNAGVHNVPDALRLAPGIEVARIDENKWAISARGFNGRFTNKLLVLIDGRSVYTPMFSGVYWNIQDVLLEDVDRIEVIRGPGATLWGANAVNGVINIITKEAKDTQGGLLTAGGGNELQGFAATRYGGKIGAGTYYRAYSKYFNWASSTDETGRDAFDNWDSFRGGFRIDSTINHTDSFTLQGDSYHGTYGETLTGPLLTAPYTTTFRNPDNTFSGGNVLARWNHELSRSRISLQTYFDRTNDGANALLIDHRNTYDFDFQHDIRAGEKNELIWGAGYRSTADSTDASNYVSLNPASRQWGLFSAFTQDEFAMFQQRLRVTVGSKFEHNGFTGFEMEPNARFLWTMSKTQSVWGAISRAVRTPARTEQDMTLDALAIPPSAATGGLPVMATVLGSRNFKSEDLIAYEGGYRVKPTRTLSADFAMFYNSYSNLLSAEPQAPFVNAGPQGIFIEAPLVAANKMGGSTYGTELFTEWKPISKWKLSGSYSFLHMNIHRNADSLDTVSPNPAGASPQHQYYLRSSLDLPKRFEQDVTLRYVSKLQGLAVPSYYSLDAHVSWNPRAHLELAIGGQNLTNNQHLEFRPDFINTSPTQVKRTFHTTLTVRF
jgi:iron complex outermembrane receptor protein